MILYLDGDAFPNMLKPILFRAIERVALQTFVVSNKSINIGESKNITYFIVPEGADEADDKIVDLLEEGDLVITADIPLADRVISKGAHAIDHRGERFTEDNVKQFLAIRDLMQSIRDSGETTKGPKPFSKKDAHNFANQLDQFLTQYML